MHYGEILVDRCTEILHGYPIREYTSSGITHAEGEFPYLGSLYYHHTNFFTPPRYSTDNDRYMKRNIGIIDFHIGEKIEDSYYNFSLIGLGGDTVLRDEVPRGYYEKRHTAVPDLEAYSQCRDNRSILHPRYLLILRRLIDITNPLVFLGYLAITVIVLIFIWIRRLVRRVLRRRKARRESQGEEWKKAK